jgi:hypothetical protein
VETRRKWGWVLGGSCRKTDKESVTWRHVGNGCSGAAVPEIRRNYTHILLSGVQQVHFVQQDDDTETTRRGRRKSLLQLLSSIARTNNGVLRRKSRSVGLRKGEVKKRKYCAHLASATGAPHRVWANRTPQFNVGLARGC